MAREAKKDPSELTVEEKLKALYQLQTMLSEIDKIKTLRGELPLEVQDLEDEVAGLSTRIEKIKADPAWQSISAVKNNRIYANPTGTFPWDRYSAEEALQILWAAQLFHPEQFKDLNMVEKTQAFYKKYYGYALSKENAEQILKGLSPIK